MFPKYENRFKKQEVEMSLSTYKYFHDYFMESLNKPGKSILFSLLCAENADLLHEKYEEFTQIAGALLGADYSDVEAEYTRRVQRLVMQYADRDEQGSPILDNNKQPVVIDQIVEFQKAQEVLQKEFEPKFKNAAELEKKYYSALEDTKVKVPMLFMNTLIEYPDTLEPEFISAVAEFI